MPAVSITFADTERHSLLDMIREIEDCAGECRTLLLSADLANATDSLISIGDAELSEDRYGYQFEPGDSREYQSGGGPRSPIDPGVRLGGIYVMASAVGLRLNVEVTI
jgi:hypothetical protein